MNKIHLIDRSFGRIEISVYAYRYRFYSCNAYAIRGKFEGSWYGWLRIAHFRLTLKYIWRRKPFLAFYAYAYTDDGRQVITHV